MVEATAVKSWTPAGIVRRFQALIHAPEDILLTLRIAHFMWRIPKQLERESLPGVLDRIRRDNREREADTNTQIERIARLRRPWFGLPSLRGHDTCYIRALTLYRFLGVGDRELRIHFVVEPRSADRLRGHAWVSVDGAIQEEPPELELEGRTRGLYTHPPGA